jgi:hypothetical protein
MRRRRACCHGSFRHPLAGADPAIVDGLHEDILLAEKSDLDDRNHLSNRAAYCAAVGGACRAVRAGRCPAADPGAARRHPAGVPGRLPGALRRCADRRQGGARLPAAARGQRVAGMPERGRCGERRRRGAAPGAILGRSRGGTGTGARGAADAFDVAAGGDHGAAPILRRGFPRPVQRRAAGRRTGDRLPARKRGVAVAAMRRGAERSAAEPLGELEHGQGWPPHRLRPNLSRTRPVIGEAAR